MARKSILRPLLHPDCDFFFVPYSCAARPLWILWIMIHRDMNRRQSGIGALGEARIWRYPVTSDSRIVVTSSTSTLLLLTYLASRVLYLDSYLLTCHCT